MIEPRRDDSRFQPTMSAVFEETEPESSFKETDKYWKQKRQQEQRGRLPSKDVPQTVPEVQTPNESNFEDRDDDFSDDDEPVN